MGLKVTVPPEATFYIWLDLGKLPEGMRNGMSFFEECLKEKVIVVPGSKSHSATPARLRLIVL